MVLSFAGCTGSDSAAITLPAVVSTVVPGEAKVGETITVNGQNFGPAQGITPSGRQ